MSMAERTKPETTTPETRKAIQAELLKHSRLMRGRLQVKKRLRKQIKAQNEIR